MSPSSPCVVLRVARRADRVARGALLRRCLGDNFKETFFYFFCQELTLECCVLSCAVLFIWAECGLAGCGAVLPAAVVVVAAAVRATHSHLADKQIQGINNELIGWVVEVRGPLSLNECAPRMWTLLSVGQLEELAPDHRPLHSQIVGTVSLSDLWGEHRGGWLHALAVHPGWRRRRLGLALLSAARAEAAARGLHSLECVTSDLQHAARTCFHAAGWQLRGSYHRRVVGAALTLPVAQLGLDLPHA